MNFKQYLKEETGSFLDNKKIPKLNQNVWFLSGMFGDIPKKGKVLDISDIDRKGLSNTYLEIETSKEKKHVNIMLVFDHKPKKTKIKDEYGELTKWI